MAAIASTTEPLVARLPLVFIIHFRPAVFVTMRATELLVVRGLVTFRTIEAMFPRRNWKLVIELRPLP